MKTGTVAQMMDRNQQTITNWVARKEFQPFLSPGARAEKGGQRDFNDNDVIVINTIRSLLAQNRSWADITEALSNGQFVTDLPNSAATVERAPIQIYANSLVATQQLEETRRELMQTKDELRAVREQYEQKLTEAQEARRCDMAEAEEARRRDMLEREDAHKKELADLYRQIGKLEGKIEILAEKNSGDK